METLAKAESDVDERKKKREEMNEKYENEIEIGES